MTAQHESTLIVDADMMSIGHHPSAFVQQFSSFFEHEGRTILKLHSAFGVDVKHSSMLHHHGPTINDQFAALIDMNAGRGVNGPDSSRSNAHGRSTENVQPSCGTCRLSCAELTSRFDEDFPTTW